MSSFDIPKAHVDYELDLPQGYLSPSQVIAYINCGESYRRRYVLGEKYKPSAALWEGKTHHTVLELSCNRSMKGGRHLETDEAYRLFETMAHDLDLDTLVWDSDSLDDMMVRADKWYRKLFNPEHEHSIHPFEPHAVEHEWAYDIAGVPYRGRIDAVSKHIVDFKVSGKKQKARGNFAMESYVAVMGKPHTQVVTLQKDKYCSINWDKDLLPLTSTAKIVHWTVANVARAISNKVFNPTLPANWWCGPKWCDHWKNCRGWEQL